MKRFSEYNDKEKKFRILCYVFSFVMVLLSIGTFIYDCISHGGFTTLRCLGPIIHISIIYIVELVFRVRVSNFVLFFYNFYVFIASVLGTSFNFYNIPYYDDLMHTLFGYVGGFIGLYILIKFGDYEKMSTFLIALVCFFVIMGSASLWEILEYVCDKIGGTTAQGAPINGIIPLEDTMKDIIDSFYGMIVFEINFIIHRKTNKKLLIGNVIEDFANN